MKFKLFLISVLILLTSCGTLGTYHLIVEERPFEMYSKPSKEKCKKTYVTLMETEIIEFFGPPCNVEIRRPVGKQ